MRADKLYYKIGEAAETVGVRTSVLRFWETEFTFLKPVKSSTGQRLYTKDEVEKLLQVKHLLYNDKYTIEGVKKQFSSNRTKLKQPVVAETAMTQCLPTDKNYAEVLVSIKNELRLLRDTL